MSTTADAPGSLHDADCPMTNERPEARTACICDTTPAGGGERLLDTPEGAGQPPQPAPAVARCEAEAKRGTGQGVCGAVLDVHGLCPRAGQHL